jgi:hypothetical protein
MMRRRMKERRRRVSVKAPVAARMYTAIEYSMLCGLMVERGIVRVVSESSWHKYSKSCNICEG